MLKFPPFMLDMREVVISLVESPKCVCTQIREEIEAPVRNRRNWTLRFCQDRRQSGAPSSCNEVLLLRPSGVWTVERLESWQPKELKWRLVDLSDEK
jgi:hypothetical protein